LFSPETKNSVHNRPTRRQCPPAAAIEITRHDQPKYQFSAGPDSRGGGSPTCSPVRAAHLAHCIQQSLKARSNGPASRSQRRITAKDSATAPNPHWPATTGRRRQLGEPYQALLGRKNPPHSKQIPAAASTANAVQIPCAPRASQDRHRPKSAHSTKRKRPFVKGYFLSSPTTVLLTATKSPPLRLQKIAC